MTDCNPTEFEQVALERVRFAVTRHIDPRLMIQDAYASSRFDHDLRRFVVTLEAILLGKGEERRVVLARVPDRWHDHLRVDLAEWVLRRFAGRSWAKRLSGWIGEGTRMREVSQSVVVHRICPHIDAKYEDRPELHLRWLKEASR